LTISSSLNNYVLACAGEMCRFGAGELHCLGAIVGGMAAQEAIKLVTHQFVPLAGVLVYNAMSSTSSVFNF
jgi:amyloid beta precursor protein binding protein 1